MGPRIWPEVTPVAKTAVWTAGRPRPGEPPWVWSMKRSAGIQGMSPPVVGQFGSSLVLVSRAIESNLEGSALSAVAAASARVLASFHAGSVEATLLAPEVVWFGPKT